MRSGSVMWLLGVSAPAAAGIATAWDMMSGSSKSVVKKAYRRLVSREQTEYATVKMVEVRDALETILTS